MNSKKVAEVKKNVGGRRRKENLVWSPCNKSVSPN
jgi:hypothetical protein